MLLAIRGSSLAKLLQRFAKADGRQRVTQHAALRHMHAHRPAGRHREPQTLPQRKQLIQTPLVTALQQQFGGNPRSAGQLRLQPEHLLLWQRPLGRNPQGQTLVQRMAFHSAAVECVGSLGGSAAPAGDQLGHLPIAMATAGQQDKTQTVLEHKATADQQVQGRATGGDMGSHHAGQGAFIRDGQRGVAERAGRLDQFLWRRSTLQEGIMTETMQLGIGREIHEHRHTCLYIQ